MTSPKEEEAFRRLLEALIEAGRRMRRHLTDVMDPTEVEA